MTESRSTSWVDIDPASDFSLANFPFGIISTAANPRPHVATAIGAFALDFEVLATEPLFKEIFPSLEGNEHVLSEPTLNAFAALGRSVHQSVRSQLQNILATNTQHPGFLKGNENLRAKALIPLADIKMHLPMHIGDYTDFYAGYHHAYNVGVLFRGPQNALQPNYTHLPVGYHGRASSIVVSGTPIQRPVGQIQLEPGATPTTGPSRKLDIELELGCFIAQPNAMGEAVTVEEAADHIFGYVLLNDWSARDIQAWEYVPLGPFNGKNFGSTISPWVVLADALEPFRARGVENPTALQEYLKESRPDNVLDIQLEVDLTTPEGNTTTIGRTSSKNLMWSFPQMIAHHTLGGCPMQTGDLLGSGTISGVTQSERGSLLEMSEGGKKDILLQGMDVRRFLKDGDAVTLRGFAGPAGARVGFGACSGRIVVETRKAK